MDKICRLVLLHGENEVCHGKIVLKAGVSWFLIYKLLELLDRRA
jgi:hypothetical protein